MRTSLFLSGLLLATTSFALLSAMAAPEMGDRIERHDPADYKRLEICVPKAVFGKAPLRFVIGFRAGEQIEQFHIERPGTAGYHVSGEIGAISDFRIDGDQLTGTVQVRLTNKDLSAIHHFRLTANLTGDTGTGTCHLQLSDPSKKRGGLEANDSTRSIAIRVLTTEQLQAHNAFAADASWSKWRGQHGSGCQSYGHQLIDSWSEARLQWKAEGWLGTFRGQGNPGRWHSGIGEMIVVNGKIYFFHYEGDGKTVKLGSGPRGGGEAKVTALREAYRKQLQSTPLKVPYKVRSLGIDAYFNTRYSLLANDILECWDAATGARLWRKVYTSKGINSKSLSEHWGPVHHDGAIIFIGSSRRMYCIDAETGETLWEQTDGWGRDEAMNADSARDRALKTGNPNNLGSANLMTVAGNIVYYEGRAYDVKTGARKWTGPNGKCTPQAITLDGKPHLLVVGGKEMHLLDATSGKVLWTKTGIARPANPTPAISLPYVFFRGIQLIERKKKDSGPGKEPIGPQLFKISRVGAELVWTGPVPNAPNWPLKAGCSAAILDGHVYTIWDQGNKMASTFACFDMKDGRLIGTTPVINTGKAWQSLYGGDGRIFYSGFGTGPVAMMRTESAGGFKALDYRGMEGGGGYSWDGSTCVTSLYVDGRIIYRGGDSIYCLDVRKPNLKKSK